MLLFFEISFLLNFALSLILGVFVLLKNNKSKINRLWFLVSLAIAVWSFGLAKIAVEENYQTAWVWNQVLYTGAIFIPILYLHFLIVFLNLKKPVIKFTLAFGYVISLVFFVLSFTRLFVLDVTPIFNFKHWIKIGVFYYPFFIYFCTYILLSLYLLIDNYRRLQGLKRQQIKYLLISTIIGMGGGVTVFFPQLFGIYPFGSFFVIFYIIGVAYAIVKLRLMGIRLVIRRGAIYTISAILVFLIYTGLVFLAKGLFENYATENRFALNSIAIVIIALGFEPLRRGVRGVIDAWFFPEGKKIEKSLQKIKEELPKTVDFNQFSQALAAEIGKILPVANISFFLLNKKEGIYHQIFPENEKDRIRLRLDDIMVKYMLSHKEIVIQEELALISENLSQVEREETAKIGEAMERYGWQAALPIGFVQANGLLFLAGKKNKDAYTSEDLKFLDNLKNQASGALDNAILYKEAVERIKVS